jgi:hypothetical protein
MDHWQAEWLLADLLELMPILDGASASADPS